MALSSRARLLARTSHTASVSAPCSAPHARLTQRRSGIARAGDGEKVDWFKQCQNFFDFESWAPRSSRFWRLRQYDYESSTQSDDENESVADLEARLSRARASGQPAAIASVEEETPVDMPLPMKSFSDAEDSELASALGQRIQQLTKQPVAAEAEDDALEVEEAVQPLTAEELRILLFRKYGKSYDMSIVRRDIPGKTFVCLNVMWSHLEQRSFNLTEEQYMEKLDSIAYLVNAIDQSEVVRSFLLAPAKSKNGMPPRPVVGTAISIQLNASEATIEQWFGRGYQ